MREKRNHKTNRTKSPQRKVRFHFASPTATSVSVAGTFNDWRPGTTPMVPIGDGMWFKELVLQPGSYEYCLVVDNQWIPDPRCSESVPNPFGGMNSLLRVTNGVGDTTKKTAAAK